MSSATKLASAAAAPASANLASSSSIFSMLAEVSSHALSEYKKSLSMKVMMIDALMAFSASNVLIQVSLHPVVYKLLYTEISNFLSLITQQCVYVLFVGTFPFNSFLAGVFCNLGMFVLAGNYLTFIYHPACLKYLKRIYLFYFAASLRLQSTSVEFKNISSERAFGDFALCSLVLFFVVFSFLG